MSLPNLDARRHARTVARTTLVLAFALALQAPSASAATPATPTVARPDHLVVLSTTDVKGMTSPCGCHIPKGGFARRAAFADSIRAEFGQVLLVDSGGWFPEGGEDFMEKASFQADELGRLNADAVGISHRELEYGLGFLRAVVAHGKTNATCANLVERASGKPVLPPWRLVKSGNVNVGLFSLMSDKAELGPAKDSVKVLDPLATAQATVTELRKRGATVVVLLSNLGRIESEDLVASIDGIDAVIVGLNIAVLPQGRTVKGTVANYGGEQGHYIGVTDLTLGADGRMTSGENHTFELNPEIPENKAVLQRVRTFEDAFNEHQRELQKKRTGGNATGWNEFEDATPHYLGAEFCGRCHAKEYAQWRTTSHAQAWQTLVDVRKDATEDCQKCHVVGYGKPGGFAGVNDAAKLANVQCENCHGMGTEHDAWPAARVSVPEATCRGCHTEITSPDFQFSVFRPHILHDVPAVMPPLPPKPKTPPMMRG